MKLRLFVPLFAAIAMSTACQSTASNNIPASAVENNAENTMTDFNLPEIPPAKLFQHPTPQIMSLDNGIPFWYVQNPMVPLMSLKLVFTDGAASDPAEKSGLSAMTASMLKEGAAHKTAQQLSDDIENLGATVSTSVNQDASFITIQSLTQYFENCLDILADIWLKPDFEQASFERLQKIILNRLKQREDSPDQIAKLASNRDYFGDSHPYARASDGYINTLQAITLDDIKNRYKTQFPTSTAAFIAVGNMPAEDVRELLNARFGTLQIDAKPEVAAVPDVPTPVRSLTIVDKPDAPQTVIRIYQPAIPATSLKTLPWQFVNIPFGGSFTSRLMQNIREDKGYSYGANAVVSPMRHAGVMLSTSSVATEVTGPALLEFIHELTNLPKGDFTQDEFERARETWKSEFVQSFETQNGVIATITGLYLNQKPIDAINAFARSLEDFTLEQFNDAAREFPTLDQASITLVGDKKAILEQLKDFPEPLPEPTFRDSEGKLITP